MTNSITPTRELVREWQWNASLDCPDGANAKANYFCTLAAQWGADQELEACCEWLAKPEVALTGKGPGDLRAARRPKSLSLKEQALQVLASAPGPDYPRVMTVLNADEHALIRQALEALPND